MKILIISATMGEGHNSFAKATKEYYRINHPEIDVKIIDLYKPYHKFTAWFVNDFSFFFLRHFPKLSVKNYERLTKNPVDPLHNTSLNFGNIAKKSILKQINEYQPNFIFTVQTYATALINELKRLKIIDIPHYSLIPDFVIQFDVENHIASDLILVSNNSVVDVIKDRGFDLNKIVVTGLPVHPKFNDIKPVNKERKVITVLFGGIGLHRNYKVVKKLWSYLDDYNIVVVNGHDKKSYRQISKLHHKNLINIKYTDRIAELLNASDVVIGKIGGSTTSECLQVKVPLISPFTSYCHEEYSLKLLEKHGLAFKTDLNHLPEVVNQVLSNKPDFNEINKVHNFNSTKDICEVMLKKYNDTIKK